MPALVLVTYASRYGSTREVARAIAETLEGHGVVTSVAPMTDVTDLAAYALVVMGAPLYMYRWHKDARRFLVRHRAALTTRPVAIFVLGPVHDPHDGEEWKASETQLDKELAHYPWLVPAAVMLFGGKCDPANLRFPLNLFAGKEPASDIRDWSAIRAWARDVALRLLDDSQGVRRSGPSGESAARAPES